MVVKHHLTGSRHGILDVCRGFIFVFCLIFLCSLVLWSEIWSRIYWGKQDMSGVVDNLHDFIVERLYNRGENFENAETLSNVTHNGRASCDSEEPSYRRTISFRDLLKNKSATPRKICRCGGTDEEDVQENRMYTQSMCSAEATLRGRNQSVISFSLFAQVGWKGNGVISLFLPGVKANYDLMGKFYPGWIMRVYTNMSFTSQMCDTVCSSKDLFFCDIHQLPYFGNVENMHPMTWRFLPLGDPTVSKFLVRDLDSRLNQREKDAVDEWLRSDFAFHGMRDHPLHVTYILGGMWGADNERVCYNTARKLQLDILKPMWKFLGMNDQGVLNKVIYKTHRSQILTHDSYLCKKYMDSVPFPTRRINSSFFVGSFFPETVNFTMKKCPIECRPVFDATYIMGGMWGADNERVCYNTARKLELKLLKSIWKFLGMDDQDILSLVIYRRHRKQILTHDSYLCGKFGDSVPVPTRRLNVSYFVGSIVNYNSAVKVCPKDCRPSFAKDWDYC